MLPDNGKVESQMAMGADALLIKMEEECLLILQQCVGLTSRQH